MNRAHTGRSAWGRSRFGGGTGVLLTVSLAIGAGCAALLGGLFARTVNAESPWLAFALLAVATLPVFSALSWVLLVDRGTITEAAERPEESVESDWYAKAAAGAFQDFLFVGGIGAAVFAFLGIDARVELVLAAVLVVLMLDFGARYLWQKRRATR
ncbi:hypothetical protein [Leucobacter sp. M11]|uniref:hypothetical protein n=1 Tax=Leucobacter sp. M11 TaxID=2993565 RepID=UPI002D7F4F29|nr:hypothetical protein [Leucobacter sp. M11]MEB4615820.1 hypothetical protein [Leucobacter sp. M11]